jgi:hypothetical protein
MAKSDEQITKKELEAAKQRMLEDLYEKVKIDRASLEPADAPPASAERAAEIARMPDFGFLEFYELTGIDQGRYSTFIIRDEGIRPTLDPNEAGLSASARRDIRQITGGLTLEFPCIPDVFADWYHLTRATNGVSDFPLAQGFLRTLRRQERPSKVHGDVAVSSEAIIAAFSKASDAVANRKWWDERLRSATKHEGLLSARAQKGAAKRMSTWYPRLIGLWLIEKGHMSRSSVTAVLASNFPDCDLDLV